MCVCVILPFSPTLEDLEPTGVTGGYNENHANREKKNRKEIDN